MKKILIPLLLLCVLSACSTEEKSQRQSANGIYYWRTTFQVSEYEQEFLQEQHIKRLYLHLFDIDIQQDRDGKAQPSPIASIQFRDSANLASTMALVEECVPTVFITLPALKAMQEERSMYCQKLCKRILNMCSYHGLRDKVKEVQLDCDWTQSTEQMYFDFLREIRELLREEGIQLSVTVRLHQLRTAEPPVDRGVLMIYNTGSIKHPGTKNSILSYEDVEPYLRNFSYQLPLDYAFPVYEWGVCFRNKEFLAILREPDYDNTRLYDTEDGVHYKVMRWHRCEEKYIWEDDEIRREQSDFATIERIKRMLPYRKGTSIILYHLDESHLKNFNRYEKNSLYNRPCVQ